MHCSQKPPVEKRRFYASPRILCILVFTLAYLVGLSSFAPQASAASLSNPGGAVSDPTVRQVDIARPAVVRIITTIDGQLTVHFTSSASATFPQSGGFYSLELSGSGALISAHGDILTADHVVNPPRGADLDNGLYAQAAQDVANYINTHFQVTTPYSANDAYSLLAGGSLSSKTTYGTASSKVYLSTSYAGEIGGNKLENVSSPNSATVDKIEAQSDFNADDVAIIHVSGMDNLPSIQLGDSSKVAEQDVLTIIGYPGLADLSDTPNNLLTSSINKVYVSAFKTTDDGVPVIQVGGNVEHGDSGGPALDANGAIVGIVSFGYSGTNGDFGETSFLQASNSARSLIRSLNLNTTPGALEGAWTQAFNDYAAGHWQTAAQELQSLAHSYPAFQGITSYLTYARTQAGQQSAQPTSSGGSNTLWIVLLLVLILLVIIGAFVFVFFRKNARPAVVAPGAPQYSSNAYGAYSQPSNGYPPANAYVPYAQPAPGMRAWPLEAMPVAQPVPGMQPVPSSATYANYTSPAAYNGAPGQIPQTPQPVLNVPALYPLVPAQPAPFAQPPMQTPRPLELGAAQPLSAGEPLVASVPAAGTLAGAMDKSASYVLPADQAEALGARMLDGSPARLQLPDGNSWPAAVVAMETVASVEEETAKGRTTSMGAEKSVEKEATVREEVQGVLAPVQARAFSLPRRPSSSEIIAPEASVKTGASNQLTWLAPCGHANTPDVYFCRVCGQPVTPIASNSDGA